MTGDGTRRTRRAARRPSDGPAADSVRPTQVPGQPVRAPDDSDVGWGERHEEAADGNDRRLLEDRPPHYGGRAGR
ncbi:MAG TPA: hypothetical protein VHC41_09600 [Mycobacteriales bacterium]|nr:hypothetical protein [Mycobacteriales bacterium]